MARTEPLKEDGSPPHGEARKSIKSLRWRIRWLNKKIKGGFEIEENFGGYVVKVKSPIMLKNKNHN